MVNYSTEIMSVNNAGTIPVNQSQLSRVDYIDWLRVITTLSVFLFHSARFFDSFNDWHVRNSTTWIGGDIIVGFMDQWIMPMFMVLAGASTYYSLKSRTAGQYARERVLRLLVPFLFGVLIIIVPQAYYELLFRNKLPCTNIIDCYILYIVNLPQRFADFSFYHLWFLAVLFIYSLICLPLFLDLFKKGKSPLAILSARIDAPWKLLLLLVLPLALINILIYPGTFWGSRDFGGWCLIAHLLFFISGYVVFANPGVNALLRKLSWYATAGAIIAGVALIPLIGFLVDWKNTFGTAGYAVTQFMQAVLSWCLMLCIINLVRQSLNYRNRFLAYASEAVLPFYILHQTVIIVVGYYIVQLNLDPGLKYLIIAAISFSVIMAIYDLLIKRINVLRFLFGMRPKKKQ
jgi:glucans biosynthesis protein C